MRICFIASQFGAWGKIGGFGVNTRRLARELARLGHEVHAVIPQRNGPKGIEILDGVAVHGQTDLEVFTDLNVYREIDADIYHSEEPTVCTYWAQRAAPNRVHIVTCRDPRHRVDRWVEFTNATWGRRLRSPPQWLYENSFIVHRAVRAADAVFVEAKFLQGKAQSLYHLPRPPGLLSKPIEIPPGPFHKAQKPLCVFVGRFDKRKRPELFFRLAERNKDIDFIAVGRAHDKSYQDFLERRYFDLPNLRTPGYIDPFVDNRLHDILSRAWLLVHPAAREGMPTVFHEAGVREMSIVAFVDPEGYTSRFGRVVSQDGDLDALEAAVRAEIQAGGWRVKGLEARRYNRRHHAVDIAVGLHLDAYSRSLGASGEDGPSDSRPGGTE